MEFFFAFRLEFYVLALNYGLVGAEHHLLYFVAYILTHVQMPVVLLGFPGFFELVEQIDGELLRVLLRRPVAV